MTDPLEIAANLITTLSILLAARNSRHTWSSGILGCLLFALLFQRNQLYADALLQGFFIATSARGWWLWRNAGGHVSLPVSRISSRLLALCVVGAVLVTAVYGALLHAFTNAWAPFVDAAVLALSVVAQLLLMQRRIENWAFWLAVNTLAVPLFASRGLWLTAGLYSLYWFNAWYGAARWRKELRCAVG